MKSRACCCLPPESCENKKPVERENIMLGKSLPIFLRMRRRSNKLQRSSLLPPTNFTFNSNCPQRKEKKLRLRTNKEPTGWIILSVNLA